jgi:single-stranded-DNA-specific exonuclease
VAESPLKAFAAEPYEYADVRAVADGLELSEPVAVTLVRRGYKTPELARAFLDADESYPPSGFESMEVVVERVLAAVEEGRRITIHGDFDVDGVCATTIMIGALRELGAECDWLIPDRLTDGYGLSSENVEKLAARGTSLLVTVDCGITAVEQVAQAKGLGLEVIVTDHHQAAAELPDCLILHPEIDGYPFASLCGTAVAWKLATALREAAGLFEDETVDLDLVALATVADVVPLVGENRSLVRRGVAEIRRAHRVGLRALIAAAKCEPTRLDEGDLAFKIAPRINAAGRLYRADAGVELLLTDDEQRAEQIAIELSRANSERRATEREVDTAAEAARRALPDELRESRGLVLAGGDWHPGVVGIVASRLVERHHRPVVVISLDGEGGGRGSGRSIPGFDLLAALEACSEHLESFGGHRAAAGLSLRAENLEVFRAAFAAHANSVLAPEDLQRTERIDAMVGGVGLGLDLAEELGRLAPFGMGNPGVRLLVPSARVSDVRTMGEDGKHSRFSLHSGSHRALGVAFGRSSLGVEAEEEVDAAVRLEVNHWNGAVEPRVVLRELYPLDEGPVESEAPGPHVCGSEEAVWWSRFEAELERDPAAPAGLPVPDGARTTVRGASATTVAIAELVSSGAGVLAVCADASRRARLAGGGTGLARFNGGAALIACHRCDPGAVGGLSARAAAGLALTDYMALESTPELAAGFEHVVLVDPPRGEGDVARTGSRGGAGGYLHPLWSKAEVPFAIAALEEQLAARKTVARVFRALRERGETGGAALREALSGEGSHPLAPESAARSFRVLQEVGLVAGAPASGGGAVGVVSSEGTDLERSGVFRAYHDRIAEARRFLERPNQP